MGRVAFMLMATFYVAAANLRRFAGWLQRTEDEPDPELRPGRAQREGAVDELIAEDRRVAALERDAKRRRKAAAEGSDPPVAA